MEHLKQAAYLVMKLIVRLVELHVHAKVDYKTKVAIVLILALILVVIYVLIANLYVINAKRHLYSAEVNVDVQPVIIIRLQTMRAMLVITHALYVQGLHLMNVLVVFLL